MKILQMTSVHVPFDTRIFYKECRGLCDACYEVHLAARYDKDEEVEGIRFHRVPSFSNKYARLLFSQIYILKIALGRKYDVYHFHDPELVPLGALLKVLTRAKVIYDIHEDYPKYILDKKWIGPLWLRKIFSKTYSALESFSSVFFDRIVVVTEEIGERFRNKNHLVLKNYVSLDFIDRITPLTDANKKFVAVYLGDLSQKRGIKEAIEAMEILGGAAELRLMGKWGSRSFMEECESLPGWKHTKYLGSLRLEEAYGYLKGANAGLHCIYPSDYFLKGIPTKLFEYAACRLPVIITHSPYWEKEFGEIVLFTEPKAENIASGIRTLIENPEIAKDLGNKARKFVESGLSWESECEKLIEMYEGLKN